LINAAAGSLHGAASAQTKISAAAAGVIASQAGAAIRIAGRGIVGFVAAAFTASLDLPGAFIIRTAGTSRTDGFIQGANSGAVFR